jgi:hypothetical protein
LGGINHYLDGKIAEVLIYSKTLNEAERVIIENYLSSKYNIPLTSTDIFGFEATHGYDIAAVGRKNADMVMSARGNVMEIADPAGLSSDGKYAAWGHDNATLAPTNVNTPTAYGTTGERMTRVWRVDKTSNVGSVKIKFHLDGIATGASTNFELLIDADGDFTDATRISANFSYDADCNIATWSSITPPKLPDGSYVTIGNPNGLALMQIPIAELAIIGEDEAIEEEMTEEELIAQQRAMEIFDEATETVQMKLYPNPTEGTLTIENMIEGATIEIYNTLGQVVFTAPVINGKNQYDFSYLNTGLYVVQLKDINMETINISQLMIAK